MRGVGGWEVFLYGRDEGERYINGGGGRDGVEMNKVFEIKRDGVMGVRGRRGGGGGSGWCMGVCLGGGEGGCVGFCCVGWVWDDGFKE